MKSFGSADDILKFAIENEEDASRFYTDLSGKMKNEVMARVFLDFAEEERKHKQKLLAVREGKGILKAQAKVADLKLADYLVDVEATPDMDYQKALVVAMKKEKAAFKLYTDLAGRAADEALRSLFQGLAMEEAKHKLRFEIEYDERILTSE